MGSRPQSNMGLGDEQRGQPSEMVSQGNQGRPGQMPILTDEERAIMKECEKDSFYKRALPLSFGCMLATQGLIKTGRWSPHPRFGPWPKMIIFGGVGYFIGKIMYLPVCQQKILDRIPNSNLATAIRKSRGIPQPEGLTPSVDDGADEGYQSRSKLSDNYSASDFGGLDDRNRPSVDREVKPDTDDKEGKKSISYEELRRRNRQEYEDNIAKRPPKAPGAPSYKDSPLIPQRPWPEKPKSGIGTTPEEGEIPPPPEAPARRKRTNIWGDPIDD